MMLVGVGASACAVGLLADAVCEEFAVIHGLKCQLRSERKLGRKAEALPHVRFEKKVRDIERFRLLHNEGSSLKPVEQASGLLLRCAAGVIDNDFPSCRCLTEDQ